MPVRLLDGETLEDLADDDESRSGGAVAARTRCGWWTPWC